MPDNSGGVTRRQSAVGDVIAISSIFAQTQNGYSAASEYVRELNRTDQRRRMKDKLDAMLLEGLQSGESIPVDAKFWDDLKQESMAKLAVRKKATRKRWRHLLSGDEHGLICRSSS